VLVNSQAELLFGYLAPELLGQPVEILIPASFRGGHQKHREGYFAHPRVRRMGEGLTLYGRRKDGSEFPVEISLSPLETDEGRLVTAAIRDVTERQLVERTLAEKNVELERANQTKDRFLATMSHELRTPLNAIIGFTGTLLMRLPGPLTADQEQQLQTVQSSARHLLALINDLLDLARVESGKVQLHFEPVDCRALIEEVGAALAPSARAKGLVFDTACPDGGVELHTDRRALSQILLNLTANAIKFTPAGAVRIEAAYEGKRPVIRVIDSGPGIREEDRARLFRAFEQLESTASLRHEGSGLGLHLSHRLAELLNADIVLTRTPGGGSTFSVLLPEAEWRHAS
jgi:PAS domain S-box-containing protein